MSPDLRAEIPAKDASPTTIGESFLGIRVFEKPGQVADAYMFSGDELLHKYLNGQLSESDLMRMIAGGKCQPVKY